jgi:hypothetical protein
MTMSNMSEIVNVKYVKGYVVHVRFDDGTEGDIDLSGYLHRGPIFAAFADPTFFKQVCIEGGTLAWPNGADIAPERLYDMLVGSDVGSPAVRETPPEYGAR